MEPLTSYRAPSIRQLSALVAGVLLVILSACARQGEVPPNLVLIVVDTLRADHLGAYGYDRATSSVIDRRLAARGVVFERTYAQAPWTLPSTASLLTGIDPTLLVDDAGDAWGIPDGTTTLAEHLAAAGYSTAAFIANPTLHEGNGFARGFGHFYSPPLEHASFDRHADELAERVLAWLGSRRAEPFFLYLHFLDPHDPYANEDIHDCRTPFDPAYAGEICGDEVRELALGRRELADPAVDVEHLRALYDMEIRFVDRQLGLVLDALEARGLDNTLIALTSDHGEELFEHGSFRHGETLYDELLRVPLVLRWDRHLPAGRRVVETVRLLDLYPTFLAAAGILDEPTGDGIDLLGGLLSPTGLADLPAFASHLSAGPLRLAVMHRGQKLVLFDRHARFAPTDDHEAALWKRDVVRLSRYELFDLGSDPSESQPLPAADEAFAIEAEEALLGHLDRSLGSGIRILATGLSPGSTLELRISASLADPPRALFLGEGDQLRIEGPDILLEIVGEPGPKLLILPGETGQIEALEILLDDEILDLALSDEPTRWPMAFASLDGRGLPSRPEGPAVRLWYGSAPSLATQGGRDEETANRLQALGYLN